MRTLLVRPRSCVSFLLVVSVVVGCVNKFVHLLLEITNVFEFGFEVWEISESLHGVHVLVDNFEK